MALFSSGMKPNAEDINKKEKELNSLEELQADSGGDNVERGENSIHKVSDIKVLDHSATQQNSSTPFDYSSPCRRLFIERTSTSNTKEKEESIEVIVPQRDIGEEAVVVWDAGLVLAYYLVKHQSTYRLCDKQNPPHVVDVGAGTGVVGLVASSLGANVTLTDLPRILPLLEEGISANRELIENTQHYKENHFIRALPLKWGNKSDVNEVCLKTIKNEKYVGGPPDLILVSDCVYFEESLAPLIFTLRELVKASNSSAPILLSYEVRDYSEKKKKVKEDFFSLAERYFLIEEIRTSDCHEEYASEDIKVIKMTALPQK